MEQNSTYKEELVPQAELDKRDKELRKLYRELRWSEVVKWFLGDLTVNVITEPKGFRTSEKWYRKIQISNADKETTNNILEFIKQREYEVGVDVSQTSDGRNTIEIF